MHFAWDVFDFKPVVLQFCEPSSDMSVYFPRVLPVREIGMIGDEGEGVRRPCKVWSPVL